MSEGIFRNVVISFCKGKTLEIARNNFIRCFTKVAGSKFNFSNLIVTYCFSQYFWKSEEVFRNFWENVKIWMLEIDKNQWLLSHFKKIMSILTDFLAEKKKYFFKFFYCCLWKLISIISKTADTKACFNDAIKSCINTEKPQFSSNLLVNRWKIRLCKN